MSNQIFTDKQLQNLSLDELKKIVSHDQWGFWSSVREICNYTELNKYQREAILQIL